MTKHSKRYQLLFENIPINQPKPLMEALRLAKEAATARFDESIDLAVNLGIDPRKSDQNVRGAVVLPHGLGKTKTVAVFAQGEAAQAAKEAGADIVGFEDLAERVKNGDIAFDVVIATPDAMRLVGQLGPILGPKGLMPNPKTGTVTFDVATAVKQAKAGQVQFRADKGGVVHCSVGRKSFPIEALAENVLAVIDALQKAKPAAVKGVYLKRVYVSPTMGPAIEVALESLRDYRS
jgi:large subunit ribosomal protein L1